MKTYELNGASAQSAMLWFLRHEILRHWRDIETAQRDIKALLELKTEMPTFPEIDTFITVPGVHYDHTNIPKTGTNAPETDTIYPPIVKGK